MLSGRAAESEGLVRKDDRCLRFCQEDVEQSIVSRFEEQVCRYGDRLAIVEGERNISYAELNCKANRLAHWYRANWDDRSVPVLLVLEQGEALICGILGVLKTGNIYVPVDPKELGCERFQRIIDGLGEFRVVTDERSFDQVCAIVDECSVLHLDRLNPEEEKCNLTLEIAAVEPACVLYTSGSTGEPKGVVHSHRNVLHTIRIFSDDHQITEKDRLLLLFSGGVLGSLRVTFGGLLNGATLYRYGIQERGIVRLKDFLRDKRISYYQSVPTVFRLFIRSLSPLDRFPDLRIIRLGGEPIYRSDFENYKRYFSNDCVFISGMGTTETGTIRRIPLNHRSTFTGERVPLGFEVEQTEVVILGEEGNAKAADEVGEITVISDYLALGYWGNEKLSDASFTKRLPEDNRRMYKTGDLGYIDEEGCLFYAGRKDFQVKVRGYRVELAEIERVLYLLDAVKLAVAMVRTDSHGFSELVACIEEIEPNELRVEKIKRHIADRLPMYMHISEVFLLDSIPLTSNGKIDRQSLQKMVMVGQEPCMGKVSVPSETLEVCLLRMFREALGNVHAGIDTDFFAFGGDSVKALFLCNEISLQLGIDIRPPDVIANPTVRQLAQRLDNCSASVFKSLVPLKPAGEGLPLYLIPQAGGGGIIYSELARVWCAENPLYVLKPLGLEPGERFHDSVESMAQHYVEEILQLQPEGPYHLAGLSFGGTVGWAIVQELERRGADVRKLILLDAYGPSLSYASIVSNEGRGLSLGKRCFMLWQKGKLHLKTLMMSDAKGMVEYLRNRFYKRLGQWRGNEWSQLPGSVRGLYRELFKRNVEALHAFVPQEIRSDVVLLRGRIQLLSEHYEARDLGWSSLAKGKLEIIEVDGFHCHIVEKPYVESTAKVLKEVLAVGSA